MSAHPLIAVHLYRCPIGEADSRLLNTLDGKASDSSNNFEMGSGAPTIVQGFQPK